MCVSEIREHLKENDGGGQPWYPQVEELKVEYTVVLLKTLSHASSH